MKLLSNRIINLSESQTLAMSKKSRELQNTGVDVINLSLGEPDFNTPDFIKEAAKKAIDKNFTKYMPVPGYLDVREAISKKFRRDNNLDYTANQIVISTGAKQSITNVVLSLVNPGDEVLLPVPYWVSYYEIIKLAEGIPVPITTDIDNNFKITATQLEKSITAKTKMMIFSTPCNPSGSVYSKSELEKLANVLVNHKNVFTISDEIYEYINFSGKNESLAQFSRIYNQVITINGVSKGFAMTGWRVGYIGAPQWIADACTKMQGQVTSGTCGIAQKAAKEAILANPKSIEYMKDAFLKRRDLVLSLLKNIEGVKCNVPEGAFYVFPDISYYLDKSCGNYNIKNATDLSMYLLAEAHVALVTGEAFGSPNCIRFSYATSEKQLIEAIKRIKAALGKLK